jgi:hypothetical protein
MKPTDSTSLVSTADEQARHHWISAFSGSPKGAVSSAPAYLRRRWIAHHEKSRQMKFSIV